MKKFYMITEYKNNGDIFIEELEAETMRTAIINAVKDFERRTESEKKTIKNLSAALAFTDEENPANLDLEDIETAFYIVNNGELFARVGDTYEDPDGVFLIADISGNAVNVENVQNGNINFGHEFIVDLHEVAFFMSADYDK